MARFSKEEVPSRTPLKKKGVPSRTPFTKKSANVGLALNHMINKYKLSKMVLLCLRYFVIKTHAKT